MAKFHAEWSGKIADVMIPYLAELSKDVLITIEKAEKNKVLLLLSTHIKEWAVNKSEKGEIAVNTNKCNKTYTRFCTPFMSGLLPDAAGTKSAWNTENHYFYEVLNRTGKSVFILLALSSKEMPKDQIEISDKINIHFPTKGDKPGWGYRVPFKTKTYEIKDINDKGAVFDRLDECLKEIKGFEDELLKKVL